MKTIIFDSGTLISLAVNGLLPELIKLKEIFNGKFIITKDVKEEVVDKPMSRKKFELEALRMQQLIADKVLENPQSIGVSSEEIKTKTKEMIDKANKLFEAKGQTLHLIDAGEASAVALSVILTDRGIQNVVAIDERTIRLLIENPNNLTDLLAHRMHTKVKFNRQHFKPFKKVKIIRSSELVYIMYKNNFIKVQDDKLLDALLWAVKLNGCAISEDEIKEIKKLG